MPSMSSEAPRITSQVSYPLVPLPMRVDITDTDGHPSTMTFTYCHSKNGSTMAQIKIFDGGQPVESLSATLLAPDRALIEHIYNERITTSEVHVPAGVETLLIDANVTPESGSFEAVLLEATKKLPQLATIGRFARALPERVEAGASGSRFLYRDGSCIEYDPLDLYRVGLSRDDILGCIIAIAAGGPAGVAVCAAILIVIAVAVYAGS